MFYVIINLKQIVDLSIKSFQVEILKLSVTRLLISVIFYYYLRQYLWFSSFWFFLLFTLWVVGSKKKSRIRVSKLQQVTYVYEDPKRK